MDVREVIVSEFRNTLERRRIPITQRLLEAAESPFNLRSVQASVDNDIQEKTRRTPVGIQRRRMVAQLEQHHEEQLRKLSRQYALQIIDAARRGYQITASRALNEQRSLKAEAGRGCDVYPCEQQQLRGR